MSPLPLLPATRARLVDLGYWIRPFDMLADRRRWRWQPTAPCGRQKWAALTPQQQAALQEWAQQRGEPLTS